MNVVTFSKHVNKILVLIRLAIEIPFTVQAGGGLGDRGMGPIPRVVVRQPDELMS